MEKIFRVALEAKFPTLPLDVILEICAATGKPEVAIEKLLGVYDAPVFAEVSPYQDSNNKSQTNIRFKSYDPFTERVTYTYNKIPSRTAYVKNGDIAPVFSDPKCPLAAEWNADSRAKLVGLTNNEFNKEYTQVVLYGEPELDIISTEGCNVSCWK